MIISSTSPEDIPEFIKKMFKECRLSNSKKLILHFISELSYPEFIQYARESLLDNIDLGVYIYTWKKEDTEQMLRKVIETKDSMKGLILYCDDNNKVIIEKIMQKIPNSIKANIIKDYCK
ncbi:hypothetical protein BFU36_10470 [Sulfolobus sp. A20]|nr:DUF5751 family protein [Sulfolobus sp. B1]AOL17819.1 hypothetical protein BFU36_10470 [Sulfolobus sp. A20]